MKTTTTTREPLAADLGHSLVEMKRVTDDLGFPRRVIGVCECGKRISNKGGDAAFGSVLMRHGKHRDEAVELAAIDNLLDGNPWNV
jgi:hypothetical protein